MHVINVEQSKKPTISVCHFSCGCFGIIVGEVGWPTVFLSLLVSNAFNDKRQCIFSFFQSQGNKLHRCHTTCAWRLIFKMKFTKTGYHYYLSQIKITQLHLCRRTMISLEFWFHLSVHLLKLYIDLPNNDGFLTLVGIWIIWDLVQIQSWFWVGGMVLDSACPSNNLPCDAVGAGWLRTFLVARLWKPLSSIILEHSIRDQLLSRTYWLSSFPFLPFPPLLSILSLTLHISSYLAMLAYDVLGSYGIALDTFTKGHGNPSLILSHMPAKQNL